LLDAANVLCRTRLLWRKLESQNDLEIVTDVTRKFLPPKTVWKQSNCLRKIYRLGPVE
jgi:hypothetical protein